MMHTPEGVRDLFGKECESKLKMEATLRETLKLYGFKDIQTPTFEYFDVFSGERGTASSRDMFKFIDRDNDTLVLRPDITPSIARCVGKYFRDEDVQVRLCYKGNTFINGASYQGKLKEVTQVGAELINDGSADADVEMVALTVECLLKSGLTEFQVDVGHAGFLRGLMEEAELDEEEQVRLKEYMWSKNPFGIEEMMAEKALGDDLKELFVKLPGLFCDKECIAYAKARTNHPGTREAIHRLERICELINLYGMEQYVNVDLGMMSQYGYYTGLILKAYTYGTGEAVATGGRYDALLGQFGKEAPAIGMVIVVDQLMAALARQKVEVPIEDADTMVLYKEEDRRMAILLAQYFRTQGTHTRLMRKFVEKSLEDYQEYGKKNGFGGILFIEGEDSIRVIDLKEGTERFMNPREMEL